MNPPKINKIEATIGLVPFTTTITAGHHTLLADEPEDHGGAGKGPKPHDLLLAALASCTCITLRMYANRKEWPVEEVYAEAVMERVVESGLQTTTIVQNISFKGNLHPDQVSRLLEIASKCPVHKTLAPAMKIITQLK